MTNESKSIAEKLDRFSEAARQEILVSTLRLMDSYRQAGFEYAGIPTEPAKKKPRLFGRRNTHPRKAQVISLEERRVKVLGIERTA